MPITIARIVGSNSHIDYIGRVIDDLDVETPPADEDFGFAQFVRMVSGDDEIVGVIYDSKLVNPEYASFGPRLSPRPALGSFSPDFINEQGILIGILLLGTIYGDDRVEHVVPRRILSPGQEVVKLNDTSKRQFHTKGESAVHLGYYPQVIAHAGEFSVPLLQAIIGGLSRICDERDRQRLAVLNQSLQWQLIMGRIRL